MWVGGTGLTFVLLAWQLLRPTLTFEITEQVQTKVESDIDDTIESVVTNKVSSTLQTNAGLAKVLDDLLDKEDFKQKIVDNFVERLERVEPDSGSNQDGPTKTGLRTKLVQAILAEKEFVPQVITEEQFIPSIANALAKPEHFDSLVLDPVRQNLTEGSNRPTIQLAALNLYVAMEPFSEKQGKVIGDLLDTVHGDSEMVGTEFHSRLLELYPVGNLNTKGGHDAFDKLVRQTIERLHESLKNNRDVKLNGLSSLFSRLPETGYESVPAWIKLVAGAEQQRSLLKAMLDGVALNRNGTGSALDQLVILSDDDEQAGVTDEVRILAEQALSSVSPDAKFPHKNRQSAVRELWKRYTSRYSGTHNPRAFSLRVSNSELHRTSNSVESRLASLESRVANLRNEDEPRPPSTGDQNLEFLGDRLIAESDLANSIHRLLRVVDGDDVTLVRELIRNEESRSELAERILAIWTARLKESASPVRKANADRTIDFVVATAPFKRADSAEILSALLPLSSDKGVRATAEALRAFLRKSENRKLVRKPEPKKPSPASEADVRLPRPDSPEDESASKDQGVVNHPAARVLLELLRVDAGNGFKNSLSLIEDMATRSEQQAELLLSCFASQQFGLSRVEEFRNRSGIRELAYGVPRYFSETNDGNSLSVDARIRVGTSLLHGMLELVDGPAEVGRALESREMPGTLLRLLDASPEQAPTTKKLRQLLAQLFPWTDENLSKPAIQKTGDRFELKPDQRGEYWFGLVTEPQREYWMEVEGLASRSSEILIINESRQTVISKAYGSFGGLVGLSKDSKDWGHGTVFVRLSLRSNDRSGDDGTEDRKASSPASEPIAVLLRTLSKPVVTNRKLVKSGPTKEEGTEVEPGKAYRVEIEPSRSSSWFQFYGAADGNYEFEFSDFRYSGVSSRAHLFGPTSPDDVTIRSHSNRFNGLSRFGFDCPESGDYSIMFDFYGSVDPLGEIDFVVRKVLPIQLATDRDSAPTVPYRSVNQSLILADGTDGGWLNVEIQFSGYYQITGSRTEIEEVAVENGGELFRWFDVANDDSEGVRLEKSDLWYCSAPGTYSLRLTRNAESEVGKIAIDRRDRTLPRQFKISVESPAKTPDLANATIFSLSSQEGEAVVEIEARSAKTVLFVIPLSGDATHPTISINDAAALQPSEWTFADDSAQIIPPEMSTTLNFSTTEDERRYLVYRAEFLTPISTSNENPISLELGETRKQAFKPSSDDSHWFSFKAEVGQSYVIQTSNLGSQLDTVLELRRNGELMEKNDDDGDGLASRIQWRADLDGVVDIAVRNINGRTSDVAELGYDITVEKVESPRPMPPPE